MRVLALDTTRRDGSIALVEHDRIVAEQAGDPSRTHAERLPQHILSLLDDRGIRTSDVDLFAVASGPGSFTGLRIGIATIQGLAFVHRRRVAAVSALCALAQAASRHGEPGALVGAWMDAQRDEVFTAFYQLAPHPPFDARRLIELEAPAVGDPVETLARWAQLSGGEDVVFAGDGAIRYRDVIQSHWPSAVVVEPPLLAGTIGLMAVVQAVAGETVDPGAVRPLYVRRPDAELDRDKKAITTWP